MLYVKPTKPLSIQVRSLACADLQLDETALYAVSLDDVPSLQWTHHHLPSSKKSFWSLPHGKSTQSQQVSLHPECPNALWILQRYGYGPCLLVQGNLLQEAFDSLPQDHSLAEADILHAIVLYLAMHHTDAYVLPPTKPLYICEDERDLNDHTFLDNPALASWVERQANALGMTFQAGILQPLPQETLPLVSILIPFRDAPALLKQVIDSLLAVQDQSPPFEIIGINNQSQDPETLALMQTYTQHKNIRFVDYDAPFNYATIMNVGVAQASGELILQLNNDIELITPNALTQLASWAMLPNVGAVGATLLYPDGRIQHAGCHLGLSGHVGHLFRLRDLKSVPEAWSQVQRPVKAVTGAMLMMRKAVYLELGGMNDRDFQIGFNDMDLCLKAHEKGYRNVCLSSVQAVHHESVSRKKVSNPAIRTQERSERQAFYTQYAHLLKHFDPTLSRGFDITADTGNPSSFLWKSPLKRRLLKGRLPLTPWRFSVYQCADGSLRLIWDKLFEEPSL